MARIQRRSAPKNALIKITRGGAYRLAAYSVSLQGRLSFEINEGTHAILNGEAPGAPDLHAAVVEIGTHGTAIIEIARQDFVYVD